MSDNIADVGTRLSVIVIAQEESRLKAVQLVKQGRTLELLWTKSGKASEVDMGAFAGECDLPAGPVVRTEMGKDKVAVAGFDSAGVVFYRVNVPAVKEEEIAAMAKLQAETRLPLPAEQMELAWRAGKVEDGQVSITIAAARREHLQGFVEKVRGFEPAKILLDCEGIVKVWRTFFCGNDEPAVVVSMGERNTQVCLAESGRLINAVSLDMGMEDFSAAGVLTEQTETAERFAQDMRSVLELFGYAGPTAVPVFVLSDGDRVIESIVSCLESTGLNVRAALPAPFLLTQESRGPKLTAQKELGIKDIHEYRVPIGLALMVLDGDAEELNVFERLYNPAKKKAKKHWFYSPKATGAIAAVMLTLLVAVFYVADVAGDRHLGKLSAEANLKGFIQRQTLIKTVARQRPDLLGLLSEINSGDSQGIMLDSFHFQKGQPVTISGQADKTEQLDKFEKSLQSRKGIRNVIEESATEDEKAKKVNFTIKFDYKSFARTRSRAQI